MEQRQRVVLYGQSVILGAVQASLQRRAQFEVIRVAPTACTAELTALAPNAILFDTGAGLPEPVFALLRTAPSVLLIGIDPEKNRATVWSGQQLRELDTQDLIHVIEHRDLSDELGRRTP